MGGVRRASVLANRTLDVTVDLGVTLDLQVTVDLDLTVELETLGRMTGLPILFRTLAARVNR